MEIKAADVMKLRKMTSAGMMDCRMHSWRPKAILRALRTSSVKR